MQEVLKRPPSRPPPEIPSSPSSSSSTSTSTSSITLNSTITSSSCTQSSDCVHFPLRSSSSSSPSSPSPLTSSSSSSFHLPSSPSPSPAQYALLHTVLGSGPFSIVRLGADKRAGRKVAIKLVSKEHAEVSGVVNELTLLEDLKNKLGASHPNIITFLGHYQTTHQLWVVTELMSGGPLLYNVDPLEAERLYEESVVQCFVTQILNAISFLHSKKIRILHRDIKPSNFMLKKPLEDCKTNEEIIVKLIDFGHALQLVGEEEELIQGDWCVGTPLFHSPEVALRQPYGRPSDMWSVGVTIFSLLCGYPPFLAEDDQELKRVICSGLFTFPTDCADISPNAQDLVLKLLRLNPFERLDAESAKQHPWLIEEL